MSLTHQLKLRARQWDLTLGRTWETDGSVLAFGAQGASQVVLKICKKQGDEWRAGEVLRAFEGAGAARVYEYDGGAVLLERLDPGTQLVEFVRRGEDDKATAILADVMQKLAGHKAPDHCPGVMDWARGFDSYLSTSDQQIPRDLVNQAQDCYLNLAASQRQALLLHGDLQHYNVLLDTRRGWVAIDPKGVVGELEYEVGAMLRNPVDHPEVFLSAATVERRLAGFAEKLDLDYERTLAWGFAQAVLSAIWDVEDGHEVPPTHHTLQLASTIGPLLKK